MTVAPRLRMHRYQGPRHCTRGFQQLRGRCGASSGAVPIVHMQKLISAANGIDQRVEVYESSEPTRCGFVWLIMQRSHDSTSGGGNPQERGFTLHASAGTLPLVTASCLRSRHSTCLLNVGAGVIKPRETGHGGDEPSTFGLRTRRSRVVEAAFTGPWRQGTPIHRWTAPDRG